MLFTGWFYIDPVIVSRLYVLERDPKKQPVETTFIKLF